MASGDENAAPRSGVKTPHGTNEVVPADQAWFYHPEMQARVAEAEADFREGRFTRTGTPEEAQAHLDRLKARSTGAT